MRRAEDLTESKRPLPLVGLDEKSSSEPYPPRSLGVSSIFIFPCRFSDSIEAFSEPLREENGVKYGLGGTNTYAKFTRLGVSVDVKEP